jgi:HTH-type transcriptional regulator / antitoxin HigA
MVGLRYKIIRNKKQYNLYCKCLGALVQVSHKTSGVKDEIDLLTLLIEKWDRDHNSSKELDPVQLLRSLIGDHQMKATDLVRILGVSKGYVSEILNYKKGMSKEAIRLLSEHFKVSQEAFNRPYPLKPAIHSSVRRKRDLNKRKKHGLISG